MNTEQLKVILEVLLQELNNNSIKNRVYPPNSLFKLPKQLNEAITQNVWEDFSKTIQKQIKEEDGQDESVKNSIYKALLVIYQNTTHQDRFVNLSNLLEYFYNKLVQRLIEVQKFTVIVSLEDFNEVVAKLLPLIKLQLVKNVYEMSETELKVSLSELQETIMYPIISREDCYEIIKNKLTDVNSVEFLNYEVKPVDEKQGLLAEYFKVKIHIINNGIKETHYFFLKHLPFNSDSVRENMARVSFYKEETFYKKFIPYVKKFGCSDMTNFLPECYLSRKNRFLVFDDASVNGFLVLNIRTPFTYHQLSMVYEQIAKLHSCGLIFEEKLSELLGYDCRVNEYFDGMLTESFANRNNESTENLFGVNIETNSYSFKKFQHIFENDDLDIFKDQCIKAYKKHYDIVEPSKINRNFITHGDLWCNNILFNINQKECKLLDYQMIRYNSPAFDTYFLLATNTDLNTRMKFGSKLIDEYYSKLKSNLSKYGVDIEKILTHEHFLRNIEIIKPTALVVGLSYLLMFLLPKEKLAEIFADQELSQAFVGGDRSRIIDELWDDFKYKSRYEEIIQELYLLLKK